MARQITAKVRRTVRIGTTYYGNPTYSIALEDEAGQIHIHRNSDNAGFVYGVNNPEYANEFHTYVLTPAGRISTVRKVTA